MNFKFPLVSSQIPSLQCVRWLALLCAVFAVGCDATSDDGRIHLNQADGMSLPAPGFLTSRAIKQENLVASVNVTADGAVIPAQGQLQRIDNNVSWVGEVFVPPGSDVTLSIDWAETGVPGLRESLQGRLKLATNTTTLAGVNVNQEVTINSDDYIVAPPLGDAELDLDGDGFGNLRERSEGSGADDPNSTPDSMAPDVIILYTPTAPIIDGRYDSLWETAQFLDSSFDDLQIDNILIDRLGLQNADNRNYRWAGMHDGRFLYLLVFSERSGEQTPFGDSDQAYDDDAVDIFWDGNNSKGTVYDGVDDYHAIITLLSTEGLGNNNQTGLPTTRFALGDRSAPLDVSAFEFTTCLCSGDTEQHLYEIRLDLQAAKIPLDRNFGFDIQLNNDVDGEERDEKWAWHNDTGTDDTWRFPLRMGTARLEPIPQ